MVEKVTKDGRIVLWEGGSLWAFDVIPGRDARSNRTHAHHAFQITLAAGGSVGIRTAEGLIPGPVILVAPDVPHAIAPEGRIALLFVEPESRAGVRLKGLLDGRHALPLRDLPEREERLRHIWDRPPPADTDLVRIGQALLSGFIGTVPDDRAEELDRRIRRVLDRLNDPHRDQMTLPEAAAIACLSESRFSHLFVAEVGLPFRTFLLWRRMSRAVACLSEGSRLTEAAHAAGFADSAHFSRTFLRMFGLPAAALEIGTGRD